MNPLYFGESKRPLFGLYQAPVAKAARRSGFVLSPAVGHEYLPAWPAFRQLALSLQVAGHHVLRFDFTGQGDSSGANEEGTLEVWRRDLELAVSELKDLAGLDRVGVIGLRLGASIALQAAAEGGGIDRLILWEPVIDGPAFVRELKTTRAAYLDRVLPRPKRAIQNGPALDVMGFVVTDELQASLEGLNLLQLSRRPAPHLTLVLREPTDLARALGQHLGKLGSQVTERVVESPALWAKHTGLGEARVPVDLIRSLVEEAGGPAR